MALLLGLSGCASGPPLRAGPVVPNDYRYLDTYMDWMIPSAMDRTKTPAVSIAVVDDQRVVWSKGYGFTDTSERVRATSQTLYRTGSITKLFTATEVMRLGAGGCIGLDRALEEALPSFAIRSRFAGAAPITPRALLAHHSGLPSDYLNGMWTEHPVDLTALVASLRQESLIAPPRTEYNYSNLDYSLLGRLIELCGGAPFAAVMARDVLVPLGMSRSSIGAPPATPLVAAGHRKGRRALPIELRDQPAGSLLSNVEDLAQFIRFVLADGRTPAGVALLPAGTLAAMWTPQFPGMPLDFGHDIGLGWMVEGVSVRGAGRVVWHNGGYPGYSGHLAVAPDEKLGVIVLANSDEANGLVTEAGAKALEIALENERGAALPAAKPVEPKPRVALAESALGGYAGNYMVLSQVSRIRSDEDRLVANLLGTELDLLPVASDTFMPQVSALFGIIRVSLPQLSLRFTSVGERRFAVLNGLPEPFPFERVLPVRLSAAWAARLGSYAVEAGDPHLKVERLRLEMYERSLVARLTLTSDVWGVEQLSVRVALRPISDSEAVVVGAGHGEGGVVRVLEGSRAARLFFSGFVFTQRTVARTSAGE